MLKYMVLLLFLSTSAFAQQQPDSVTIDRDMWQSMIQALTGLSMPLQAHQGVQQILESIKQEAARRAAPKEPSK